MKVHKVAVPEGFDVADDGRGTVCNRWIEKRGGGRLRTTPRWNEVTCQLCLAKSRQKKETQMKVHKQARGGLIGGRHHTECGRWIDWAKPMPHTVRWDDVTCKQCLNKRPGRTLYGRRAEDGD